MNSPDFEFCPAGTLALVQSQREAFAKLFKLSRRARLSIEELIDELPAIPDANCSCHLSPPCNDCFKYGGLRNVLKDAREVLKELQE